VELHPTLGILGDTLIRWSSMQRCLNLQPQTCHLGINSLPEIYGMSLEMVYDVYGIGFTTLMDIYGIGFTTFMDIVIHILNIGTQASTRSSVSNWCHISPATAWGATWCNCWPMGGQYANGWLMGGYIINLEWKWMESASNSCNLHPRFASAVTGSLLLHHLHWRDKDSA
jgi:hypothetical protein